jgi:hypothetical protein
MSWKLEAVRYSERRDVYLKVGKLELVSGRWEDAEKGWCPAGNQLVVVAIKTDEAEGCLKSIKQQFLARRISSGSWSKRKRVEGHKADVRKK